MNHVTYNLIDGLGVLYMGEFVTFHRNHKTIAGLINNKHPKIMLPLKETDIKVKKV
jgi:hypothetical protein